MHFIANFWWLWLIGAVVTLMYGGYNQVSRMKRMMNESPTDLFTKGWDATRTPFYKGMASLFIAAILNMGFVVLLVVAIVLNVIDYAKQ